MIAGTLGLLEESVDSQLESYGSGGFDTLDVRGTDEYLDGSQVQQGRVAATIESEQEEVAVAGTSIEVEQVPVNERVWTPWVADVTDAGFVLADRTAAGEPPFPFDVFRARTGVQVDPAQIDVAAFIRRQRDHDRDWDVWMAGRQEPTGENSVNDTDIRYGENALKKDAIQAEIGVGFETTWHASTVRGVIYAGGYVAIYRPQGWGPIQFARFVREELLPVASVPDDEDDGEQETLGNGGGD